MGNEVPDYIYNFFNEEFPRTLTAPSLVQVLKDCELGFHFAHFNGGFVTLNIIEGVNGYEGNAIVLFNIHRLMSSLSPVYTNLLYDKFFNAAMDTLETAAKRRGMMVSTLSITSKPFQDLLRARGYQEQTFDLPLKNPAFYKIP